MTVAEPPSDATSSPDAAAAATEAPKPLPDGKLVYTPPSGMDKFWTSLKLSFALPWRRFKKGSVLVMKLEGDVSDQARGRFDSGLSMPQVSPAKGK